MRGAHSHAFVLFLVFGRVYARESEIAEFDVEILVDQQIGALQIAVQNIFFMEIGHAE